ncbi:hypothetical protein [Shewanella sp. SR44-3]|uniref:hypothetical protein n=1 Tax=Shewanella sp. SR44-3 TaxID=2760936 RepID=UPI0015FBA476|nr:hypothetical protein [Shewanella sp. SR44-3]MBB1270732.1 hypothetical protein [Shewanella sp. SR44-3]
MSIHTKREKYSRFNLKTMKQQVAGLIHQTPQHTRFLASKKQQNNDKQNTNETNRTE